MKNLVKSLAAVCVLSSIAVGCGTDASLKGRTERIAQREVIVEQYSHLTKMCVEGVNDAYEGSLKRPTFSYIGSNLGLDRTTLEIGASVVVGTLYEPTWKLPEGEETFQPWIIGLKKLGTCTPPDQIGVANTTTVLK
jgi:hypothetical protein